jgi:chromosome partitioning protein
MPMQATHGTSTPQGITIVVGNEKGGEGKTTVSTTIAVMLSVILKLKVLVVGFDPQCHAELLFGHPRNTIRASIFDAVRDPEAYPVEEIIVPTYLDSRTNSFFNPQLLSRQKQDPVPEEYIVRGPDLAPINKTAMQTGELTQRLGWATFLRKVLDPVRGKYDYIIIDTNPTGGPLLGMALSAGDYVLIPVTPEELPVEGLKGIRTMIAEARDPRINPGLKVAGVLFNKTSNWQLHKGYEQQVRQLVARDGANDYRCFSTSIKYLKSIAEAISVHSAVPLLDPYSDAAKYYWHLLQELISVVGGPALPRLMRYVAVLDEQTQTIRKNTSQEQEAESDVQSDGEKKRRSKKRELPFTLPQLALVAEGE